jgi:hypothetical protein
MSNKRRATLVGILILVAYAVLAEMVLESKGFVLLLEAISGIAVIGIAILMYPFFKHIKNISLSYLLLKFTEGALMVIGAFLFYLDHLVFRDSLYLVHTYIFIVSAFLFYWLLYKTNIVPHWISCWGKVAVVLLLVSTLVESLGINEPMLLILLLPIILNEVVLAIWLMVRGFNENEDKCKLR